MSFDEAVAGALADPKYNALTGRVPDFNDRAKETAAALFEKYVVPFLERLSFGGVSGGSALNSVFIIILIILLIALIFFTAKSVKKKIKIKPPEIFYGETSGMTRDGLLAGARASAENKNYGEAVRLGYLALLHALNEFGAIKLRDSMTNGQLAADLKSGSPEAHELFLSAAKTFDGARFGNKKINSAGYENARESNAAIISLCENKRT